jgi:hypothetical protein
MSKRGENFLPPRILTLWPIQNSDCKDKRSSPGINYPYSLQKSEATEFWKPRILSWQSEQPEFWPLQKSEISEFWAGENPYVSFCKSSRNEECFLYSFWICLTVFSMLHLWEKYFLRHFRHKILIFLHTIFSYETHLKNIVASSSRKSP